MKHVKRTASLIATLLLFANLYAQEPQDTLAGKSLIAVRQQFWDSLPQPKGLINDYEDVYTAEQAIALDKFLLTFQNQTGIQLAIFTLDSTFVEKEKFDELTTRLANKWGVGEKDKNNGILIGISRSHRIIRISNGTGIEKLITNAETKEIIDNYFIPSFKKGDYFEGTVSGLAVLVDLLMTRLKQQK